MSTSQSLTVRDLDGDGEPEIMLVLNWSGMQCCAWSRIYHWDRARASYVVRNHFWGSYGAMPALRDLDRDGRTELVSADDRFFDAFSHAAPTPVQIWTYRAGKLRDVTRHYPWLIRRDAAAWWRVYLRDRKKAGAR